VAKGGQERIVMADINEIEKNCPFKKEKWWDDLTYCQEFGLCECCPKYDKVVELINYGKSEKDKSE